MNEIRKNAKDAEMNIQFMKRTSSMKPETSLREQLKQIKSNSHAILSPLSDADYHCNAYFKGNRIPITGKLVHGNGLKYFFPLQMIYFATESPEASWRHILKCTLKDGKNMVMLNLDLSDNQTKSLHSIFTTENKFGFFNCHKKEIEFIYMAAIDSTTHIPANVLNKLGLKDKAIPNLLLTIIVFNAPTKAPRKRVCKFLPFQLTFENKSLPFLKRNFRKIGYSSSSSREFVTLTRNNLHISTLNLKVDSSDVQRKPRKRVAEEVKENALFSELCENTATCQTTNAVKLRDFFGKKKKLDESSKTSTLVKDETDKITLKDSNTTPVDMEMDTEINERKASTPGSEELNKNLLVGSKIPRNRKITNSYRCIECKITFKSRYFFKKHFQIHSHSVDDSPSSS